MFRMALLFLFIVSPAIADIFNPSQTFNIPHQRLDISEDIHLDVLDFNGDAYNDVFAIEPNKTANNALVWLNSNTSQPLFSSREKIHPFAEIELDNFAYAILSSDRDFLERIFMLTTKKAKILSSIQDDCIGMWDRYFILEKEYPTQGLNHIYHMVIGNFLSPPNRNEVLVFANRHKQMQAELYQDFLDYPLNSSGLQEQPNTWILNNAPRTVFAGDINGDGYHDIVLAMEDAWRIWLAEKAIGFSPLNKDRSFEIPYPQGVIKTTSILFQTIKQYPLLIGVQTDSSNNVSYVALQGKTSPDGRTILDFGNPIVVERPTKASDKNESFLFECQDEKDSHFPLLMIGNSISNPLQQQNPYFIFRVTSQTILTPTWLQTLNPSPLSYKEGAEYYLNKPVLVSDMNGDQISDCIFSFLRRQTDRDGEVAINKKFMGYLGLPRKTGVQDREWLWQK